MVEPNERMIRELTKKEIRWVASKSEEWFNERWVNVMAKMGQTSLDFTTFVIRIARREAHGTD